MQMQQEELKWLDLMQLKFTEDILTYYANSYHLYITRELMSLVEV